MVDFLDIHRQLLAACQDGEFDTVQRVLDIEIDGRTAEVDIDDNDDGNTPLQIAAGNGHENIVRLLLMRGAALDRTNMYGWTALAQAASHGRTNIVQLLLQNKANPTIRNKLGADPLTLAIHQGHTSVVRILLDVPGIDVDDRWTVSIHQYITPLMAAAFKGNDTIVRLLMDNGVANSFHSDQQTGWTPLMIAALGGHVTTAQILIDRGANPNATNVMGCSALEIATLVTQREVAGYLDRKTTIRPQIIAQKNRKPKIIEATETGNIESIRLLLDDDLKQCNATSADGATPLMIGAMLGRFDITQLLVERGADVNKQDTKSGWTALMQATFHRRRNLVKYLVTVACADVNLQAKDGCKALDLALVLTEDVKGEDSELIHLLAPVTMPSTNSKPIINKSGSTGSLNSRLGNGGMQGQLLDDESPRNGLKAWWSRMSNRFRNLKLSRTLRLTSTTKLTPFEEEDDVVGEDTASVYSAATLRLSRHHAATAGACAGGAGIGLGKGAAEEDGRTRRKSDQGINNVDLNHSSNSVGKDSGLDVSMKSFQSAQTMVIPSPASNQPNDKLLPVIPPFLPPPSFELNNSGRSSSRLSSYSSRTSLTQLANGQAPAAQTRKPNKLSFTRRKGSSPSNSAYFSNTASPNSSGDTSTLSGGLMSVHRLPTLRSPREEGMRKTAAPLDNQEVLFTPAAVYHSNSRRKPIPPAPKQAKALPIVASPQPTPGYANSSTSSTISGSLLPRHSATKIRPVSGTSRSSTTTHTLTPTPSLRGAGSHHGSEAGSKHSSSLQKKDSSSSGVSEEDELAGMLKKLSLEKYTPIFEEQEVDLEVFLGLTESDLEELGIAQSEPRHQMLHAITEHKSGKTRAHHYHRNGGAFSSYAGSSIAGSMKAF